MFLMFVCKHGFALCLFRKRIFILGPSHHKYLSGCAITSLTQYQTPLYNLSVDAVGKHYNDN